MVRVRTGVSNLPVSSFSFLLNEEESDRDTCVERERMNDRRTVLSLCQSQNKERIERKMRRRRKAYRASNLIVSPFSLFTSIERKQENSENAKIVKELQARAGVRSI